MMKSLWYEDVNLTQCSKLDKDIVTDVLIIGGGITGISTAYHLCNKNLKICLVERGVCGCSTTSKSTGKLTFLQEDIYNKLCNIHDQQTASKYLEAQIKAIEIVKKIVKKYKIDCDLQKVESVVFSNQTNNCYKIKRTARFLMANDIHIKIGKKIGEIDSNFFIGVNDTYVFNPLKYVEELKKIVLKEGVDIYENTLIRDYYKEGNVYICQTKEFNISAKHVVFACHYPWFLKPLWLPLKTHKEQSTLIASKGIKNEKISGINIDKDIISYRYYKDYLVLLNDSHIICNNQKLNINQIHGKFSKYLNKVDFSWTNSDLMTSDYLPYIGKMFKAEKIYIATGYNTWGLTNGSLAGKIISDMILKKSNVYCQLFDPLRKVYLKNIFLNILYNTKAYLKIKKTKDNKIYKEGNKKFIEHVDEKNKKYKVLSQCPHLKCNITFNPIDKNFICPCHGSEFNLEGKCTKGPSNYDISDNEK